MKLNSLFQQDLIFWNVDVNTKEDMYKIVANKISKKYKLSKDEITKAFIKRDTLGDTSLPGGISIPHGRLDNFNDLIISIVKPKKPFIRGDQKTNIFFLILTSNIGSNTYLKTLRAFALLSNNFSKVYNKFNTPDELIEHIDGLNLYLNDTLKIKDVMNKDPMIAKINDRIHDAVDLMKKKNLIFLPITDENNKYLGKINLDDILKISYPKYILELTDLSFLNNFRAYEEFAEKEKTMLIKDIFVEDSNFSKTINQDASIVELSFLLIKNNWSHITVIDDQKNIVGIASLRDVLNKILRA